MLLDLKIIGLKKDSRQTQILFICVKCITYVLLGLILDGNKELI